MLMHTTLVSTGFKCSIPSAFVAVISIFFDSKYWFKTSDGVHHYRNQGKGRKAVCVCVGGGEGR